jgi:nucleoid-associated protein YgaU
MGQLERYGLYVLCVVIFLILGVALWGGDPALAGPQDTLAHKVASELRSPAPATASPPPASADNKAKDAASDDTVARLRRAFGTSTEKEQPKHEPVAMEPLAGVAAAPSDAGKATPPAANPAMGMTEYTVKKNDNLEAIALAHFGKKSAWPEIVKVNPGLTPTRMMTGDKIKLPPKSVLATPAPAPVLADEYEIRRDDNLESIALRKLGKRNLWRDIVAANPGLDPARLRPGTRIKIPAVAKATSR